MSNQIDRAFYASESDNIMAKMYGPFMSAEEAEYEARRVGWLYVMVEAKTTDKDGIEIPVERRFYQPGHFTTPAPGASEDDDDDEMLAESAEIEPVVIPPMNADMLTFFAEYEKQMSVEYVCAECGEVISPADVYAVDLEHFRTGTKQTTYFHSSMAKGCALKWSTKRLQAAGDKLKAILENFGGRGIQDRKDEAQSQTTKDAT